MLLEYESDDNEFGPYKDKNDAIVMKVMNAKMKANMYIPSDEPVLSFVGQYFNCFIKLAITLRKFAVCGRFKTRKDKLERTIIDVGCEGYGCP